MITALGLIFKEDSYKRTFCEFILLIYVLLKYFSFSVSFLICYSYFLCCTKLSLQQLLEMCHNFWKIGRIRTAVVSFVCGSEQ